MGKATVLSGGAAGSYQVQLDYGTALQTLRLADLDARLAALLAEVARAQGLLSVQQVLEAVVEATVLSAINAYVAASRVVPINEATVRTTLAAYTAAQGKLLLEKANTTQLRLVLQGLTSEQVQAAKDRAYWAGLTLQHTVQAWCADLTETATGQVATIEIPGENALVLLAPAAPTPTAGDGVLTAREVQSGPQLFWNAAVLPGWQRWLPTYRRGTLTAVDAATDTADVTLFDDKSSAQGLAINALSTLEKVPVKYMSCHSKAFAVGDRVVVKFKDHDWAQPTVVGFVDHPKSCLLLLSGLTRGGILYDVPDPLQPSGSIKVLRSYKPTQSAWQYALNSDPAKFPLDFRDEAKLSQAGTQYATLTPSMFSGRMAKAVQVVMGFGKKVDYAYVWAKCHGVVMGADGAPWLVEISELNGVLAMPLPMLTRDAYAAHAQQVFREAGALFGGVPSGAAFPQNGSPLASALAAGDVLQLLAPAGLADFYSGKLGYSTALGWSFSDSGHEAHNTCYTDVAGVTGYHYKVALSIGATNPNRQTNEPVATGASVLSMVSSGPLTGRFGETAFAFYEPAIGRFAQMPFERIGSPVTVTLTTILACHIDGVLELVQWGAHPSDSEVLTPVPPPTAFTNSTIKYLYAAGDSRFVSTTRFPSVGDLEVATSDIENMNMGVFTDYEKINHDFIIKRTTDRWYSTKTEYSTKAPLQTGLWPEGTRDGYMLYRGVSGTSGNARYVPATGGPDNGGVATMSKIYNADFFGVDEFGNILWTVTQGGFPSDTNRTLDFGFSLTLGVRPYTEVWAEMDAYVSDVLPPLPSGYKTAPYGTPVPAKVVAVGPVGVVDETLVSTLASPAESSIAWANPGAETHYGKMRLSMLGSGLHAAFSGDILSGQVRLTGALFSGEASPSGEVYSFLGYTE